jgi:hypothetical protein
MNFEWSLAHFEGYLNSWSAVQHFIRKNGVNPVFALMEKVREHWQATAMQRVTFPIFLKMARL